MASPLISIIMPAYNAGKFIKEAICSVLNQSYSNWELIVVNDGSIDDTEEIIKSFKDLRIKYFRQTNKGVGAARNLALLNISGDYFCFLDADDILTSHSLQCRLKVFEESPQICFVDGRVEKRNETLDKLEDVFLPKFKGYPFVPLIRLDNSCFFGPSWMIKRDKKAQYCFRTDISHSEDLLFYLSIADKGMYSYCEETILIYRISSNSAMTNLRGLENGYREVYKAIACMADVGKSDLRYLKARLIRIMFLSYVRVFSFKNALNAVLSLIKL